MEREEFEKGITILIKENAPISIEDKKELIKSFMLIYDFKQKIIDGLKAEIKHFQDSAQKLLDILGGVV